MPKGAEIIAATKPAAEKAPTLLQAPSIGEVLRNVVDEVNEAHAELVASARKEGREGTVQLGAVDVELNFRSVVLNEKGWVLFGRDTKETQLEIKLATRIAPPES